MSVAIHTKVDFPLKVLGRGGVNQLSPTIFRTQVVFRDFLFPTLQYLSPNLIPHLGDYIDNIYVVMYNMDVVLYGYTLTLDESRKEKSNGRTCASY